MPASGAQLHLLSRHGQVGELAAGLAGTVGALHGQVLGSDLGTQGLQLRLVVELERQGGASQGMAGLAFVGHAASPAAATMPSQSSRTPPIHCCGKSLPAHTHGRSLIGFPELFSGCWESSSGRAALQTYVFKFFDIVVGEYVRLLEVKVWIQRFSNQGLPEGRQEVEGQGDVRPNGDAQQLPKEVQKLLLPIADGAGRQNVLALRTHNVS